MLKYPRIAVTALSLTACALLVALWVRSYWWIDVIMRGTTSRNTTVVAISSNYGGVVFYRVVEPNWVIPPEMINRWGYSSDKAAPGNPLFDWTVSSRETRVEFPIWVPALLAASLAAAPWIRWRFRLRTLLIATTLVAVGLGILVWSS
jgi:hypothetical protein